MKKLESHIVPSEKLDVRLSEYALGKFESITTRKGIKKAIERGQVKINGKVGKTGTFIKGGETIELFQKNIKHKVRIDLELEVLYQDDHLAIINKPAGVVVSGNKKRTIENALSTALEPSSEKGALPFPLPVHRLDLPTTGCLLIAKTNEVSATLGKMFEEKKIIKTYYAITMGEMKKEGKIESEIKTKKAKTLYKIIESVPSEKFEVLNLVELNPSTGRRHQLRIHMSEMGNAILGDKAYGPENSILKGKGLYLHAKALSFTHPITNEAITIVAPTPKKFGKIFDEING